MARSGYERLAHASEQAKSLENDELEQAFESDDEDHDAVPLNPPRQTPQIEVATNIQDGAYDFEREYDHPPPGSPPRANGNSNGIIPSFASLPRQAPENTHPSFFRRAVGALLPQHYARVPTSDAEAHTRIQGSGLENDGVFSNVLAKPTNAGQSTNGNIHEMPEDAQKDAPPVCHSIDILYPKIGALILNRSHMLLLKQMLYPLIGKLLSMHLPLAAMTY